MEQQGHVHHVARTHCGGLQGRSFSAAWKESARVALKLLRKLCAKRLTRCVIDGESKAKRSCRNAFPQQEVASWVAGGLHHRVAAALVVGRADLNRGRRGQPAGRRLCRAMWAGAGSALLLRSLLLVRMDCASIARRRHGLAAQGYIVAACSVRRRRGIEPARQQCREHSAGQSNQKRANR